MKEKVQNPHRVVSIPSFNPMAQSLSLGTEKSYVPSSSAPSMGPTLQQISQSIRIEAPYAATALCSLSWLITGEEAVSSLLEYKLDMRSTLTEEDVYAALKINPELFSNAKYKVSQLEYFLSEIKKEENGSLKRLEGIAKDLQIISQWDISDTDKRFLQSFLEKLNPVVEGQKQFCQHMDACWRQFPVLADEVKEAIAKREAMAKAKDADEKAIADLEAIAKVEAIGHAEAINIAEAECKVDAAVIAEIKNAADERAKVHAKAIANALAMAEAEAIAQAEATINSKAIHFFSALYEPENFKRQMQALLQFIDNVDDWSKMDNWLIKHKERCEAKRKEQGQAKNEYLSTLADVGLYSFSAIIVQMLTRRALPAEKFIEGLKLAGCEQQKDIEKCYKEIAYLVLRNNMLRAFKEDGYIRPEAWQALRETYFNPRATNTLMQFLMDAKNASQKEAFVHFIKQHGAYAHLQFFLDIYQLFQKKPWHVTDLQLLAPYFSEANPLGLESEVLFSIQQALHSTDFDGPEKIKHIITQLIPAVKMVSDVLGEMKKVFLATPKVATKKGNSGIEPIIVHPPKLRSENDIKIRNRVAREFFKREIEKQLELLQIADIFHDACFGGLVDRICRERLTPLLAAEEDEIRFLSRYAKALLEIPYYLLQILPKNFTDERVEKQTILSYTFCSELGHSENETALHLKSLEECLLKKAAYNGDNRVLLAEVERSGSVFELFNLIKRCSDPTIYTTLKEDIRRLNSASASVFDKREKSVVPKTTKVCRTKGGKPLENNPGPETPSNTATPFPSAIRMKTTRVYNEACTPLRNKEPNAKMSPPLKEANGIIFSPTRTVFKNFIDYAERHNRWDVTRYIKDDAEETSCDDPAKYNFVRTYDEAQLIFTAEKKEDQWTVAACSHREDHVNKMVSAMAKSVNAQSKILDIAIIAPETEATELIETYIRTYVGAALEHGFLPVVTLNGKPLQPEGLKIKPQKNENLAEKYRVKSGLSKGSPVEMSRNQHVWLSKRLARPEPSARRALFRDVRPV